MIGVALGDDSFQVDDVGIIKLTHNRCFGQEI